MAFWKKSDDPWDRKPERRDSGTIRREQERTVEHDGPAEKELTPEEQRIRNIIEGPKAAPVAPEKCPYCAKDMRVVYIWSKGFTKWNFELPSGWMDDYEVLEDVGGLFDPVYKQGWYCEDCEKMVLDVKKPRPAQTGDTNSFADYARQWKEMEEREKEAKRRKQED